MEGSLLTDSTLQEMKTWVKDKKGDPVYGLGLGHHSINGFEALVTRVAELEQDVNCTISPKKNFIILSPLPCEPSPTALCRSNWES